MIPEVLSHYRLPLLSCVGLLLFMGVFVGALFWVFRNGSGRFYSRLGELPLVSPEEGSVHVDRE